MQPQKTCEKWCKKRWKVVCNLTFFCQTWSVWVKTLQKVVHMMRSLLKVLQHVSKIVTNCCIVCQNFNIALRFFANWVAILTWTVNFGHLWKTQKNWKNRVFRNVRNVPFCPFREIWKFRQIGFPDEFGHTSKKVRFIETYRLFRKCTKMHFLYTSEFALEKEPTFGPFGGPKSADFGEPHFPVPGSGPKVGAFPFAPQKKRHFMYTKMVAIFCDFPFRVPSPEHFFTFLRGIRDFGPPERGSPLEYPVFWLREHRRSWKRLGPRSVKFGEKNTSSFLPHLFCAIWV